MKIEQKTDKEILSADFNDLTTVEQERFYNLSETALKERYAKILPKGIAMQTIVLENGLGGFIRKPKPRVLSIAMGYLTPVNKNERMDMYSAGSHILDNCWACGDKEVLENDDFRFSAALQACQMVEIMQGRLKKN